MKGGLVSFIILFWLTLSGQVDLGVCGTDGEWQTLKGSNPSIDNYEDILEREYQLQKILGNHGSRGGGIILPVVVHIIHDNGSENISDSRVVAMLDIINDAFRNRNSFYSVNGVDFHIEFCLAQRDTQGLATTGIIRHESIYTDMSIPSANKEIHKIASWNPNHYINIKLVREACRVGTCNIAGYATMPPAHGLTFDGIIFEAKYAGSTVDDASVVIHEMGHYLGLHHTFLGGCTNNDCLIDGDRVCDTPPDNMTGPFPCDASYNTCQSDEDDSSINNPFRNIALGGKGDQNDMIENYMDYSAYSCYDLFTSGQKSRVHFFLNSARSSLLTSKACLPPCPNEPIALFNISNDTINAGEQVFLTNSSVYATEYSWYINGVPSGHAIDTNLILETPGVYNIKLVVETNLIECTSSSHEVDITVLCQVQASFEHLLEGESLLVIDQSEFSDNIKWIINDGAGNELFSSLQSKDTFDVTGIQYVQICQYAYDEFCFDRACIFIYIATEGIEICNNQIDDDEDGLVDLFDRDCPCTDSTFQAICDQPCQNLPDSFPELSLKILWQSEIYTINRNVVPNIIVGNADMANSGVEVITRKSKGDFMLDNVENNILVIDGNTGITNREFVANPNKSYYDYAFLAMGDIDRDGPSEIFCKDWDTIFCFNIDGSLRWVSDKLNMGNGNIVHLADFNSDGIVEVYGGNNIFNAENGKLLSNSILSAGCNIRNGSMFPNCSFNHSIAADLLPSPGLELAAGNVVYEIQINNLNGTSGNTMVPVIADDPVLDGVTSVGDIDGDGELDVVVVRGINAFDSGGIWVWNPRTRTVIASAPSGPDGGIPFIGDVDGDCAPEIGMTFEKQLRMYKYNGTSSLQLLYNLPTTDDSGITGITMFDFNQDGKNELVYRDETDLRIIAGIDGSTLASYPIKSGTGLEYPVIADVDQDGEAEIIVNGYLDDPSEQRVFCFESNGSPWAPARSVWNQPGYSVTNVNDDLTIPRYPQHSAKPLPDYDKCLLDTCATPYNSFNVQATYRTQAGCVQFPAHDLSIDLLSYTCQPDSVSICFSVANTAALTIQDKFVSFTGWPANPLFFNSSPVFSFQRSLNLKRFESDTFCFTFPLLENLDSIFIAVNDPGSISTPYTFPLTSLSECNYENNIDVIQLDLRERILDLGPDITKCESEVITLYTGPDFITYTWSDNSNDSIYSSSYEGKHFVETMDQCGRVYTDTVNFHIETSEAIHLGNDTFTCSGKLLSYNLSGSYDWIHWLPSDNVDCDTCNSIELTTDTSLYLIAIAAIGSCIYQDSVVISIKQPFSVDTTRQMCFGDTLIFHETELTSAGQYTIEVGTCDTLYNLTIEVNTKDSVFLSTQLCNNDSIWFNGVWLKYSGEYNEILINNTGCDSITHLELSVLDALSHTETIYACDGDSVLVFGQWINTSVILQDTLSSFQGCDSILTAEIIFSPFILQKDSIALCQGDSILLNGNWVQAAGTYLDTLASLPCDIIQVTELQVYPTSINTENYVLCPGDSIWLDNGWVTATTSIHDTLQNYYGCDSIRLINIDAIPIPDSPSFILDCIERIVDLNISTDALWRILWSNGDTTNQTTYSNTDTASLILTADPGCVKEFFINLPTIPDTDDFPLLNDTIINANQSLQLLLPLDASEWSVGWFPPTVFSCANCLITSISASQNTAVNVIFNHEDGCIYSDSFVVYVSQETSIFYVPNVFSPNGDGQNDNWNIFFDQSKGNIELLEVFDRWGNMVHKSYSKSGNLDWDGTYNNQLLSPGVYTYKFIFQPKEGSPLVICGDLTLIR